MWLSNASSPPLLLPASLLVADGSLLYGAIEGFALTQINLFLRTPRSKRGGTEHAVRATYNRELADFGR